MKMASDISHPVPSRSPPTHSDVEVVLAALKEATGCEIHFERGLRRVCFPLKGCSDFSSSSQERGREIFIGRLPRDLLEDELYRVVSPHGEILEIRLMLSFDSAIINRGYAFVVFERKQDAKAAIERLDNSEIRPGRRIGVKRSVDNWRLFVGGLPRDKTVEQFEEEIRKHPACSNGIRKVIMYPAVHDKSKNRGFAFVEFGSHREAALARRQLMHDRVTIWNKEICVDWAQPEAEVEPEVMDQVRIVYVRNLNVDTTEEDLYRAAVPALQNGVIEKVKKLTDYGFLHFQDREDAERAIKILNGALVGGSRLEAVWAKPPTCRRTQQSVSQRNPFSFHTSKFPQDNALSALPYEMVYWQLYAQQEYPESRGLSQRHYRNAAGTRRRYQNFRQPSQTNPEQPFLYSQHHNADPFYQYQQPAIPHFGQTSYGQQHPAFSSEPEYPPFLINPLHSNFLASTALGLPETFSQMRVSG
ncbi:hypothetical protein RvY_12711-2 [Ramazzottius varieornatus]|uniref:RRM domain-containing protein n=1 Tax=Ramazzottius varieornatus TaxID=947166 RepID=A0A1D1VKG3_RAMVA|nr:hypothetical protein RvY_12711-2 [Ramazzottius varieornatus]